MAGYEDKVAAHFRTQREVKHYAVQVQVRWLLVLIAALLIVLIGVVA